MITYDDFQTDQAPGLETLTKRIERDLEERHFCVVFEDEVERCWPKEKLDQVEREGEIQAFAKSRGWNILPPDCFPARARESLNLAELNSVSLC